MAATTSGASGAEMSTPEISAPMVGESGWTLTEVARVTAQFCPSRGGGAASAGLATYIGPRTAAPSRRGAVHER